MSAHHPWLPTEIFTPRLAPVDLGCLVAQGRVLDAVADGGTLSGTLQEVACSLGVSVGDLRVAVDELGQVGWLALERDADDQIRLAWPPKLAS